MDFRNQHFSISLTDEWFQQETDDPEQWSFISERGAITVSFVALRIGPDNIERVANKLLGTRFEKEVELRKQLKTSEPWVSNLAGGVLQLNYLGSDANDTHFFYTGFLTPAGILSVTGELFQSNPDECSQFFEYVMGGLRYGHAAQLH